MSASKAAATAAGRALLKAGSRSLPAAVRGAAGGGGRGSNVVAVARGLARGLASGSVSLEASQQHRQHHRGTQGALLAGVSCVALLGVAALMESEDLESVLPTLLWEKLEQQGSPKALARIEEVRRKTEHEKSTWSRGRKTAGKYENTFVFLWFLRAFLVATPAGYTHEL